MKDQVKALRHGDTGNIKVFDTDNIRERL